MLVGLAGVALGGVSLRVWAILRGRLDPDLVTTPEATEVARLAFALVVLLVVLVSIVLWRGPRWAPRSASSSTVVPARRTGRLGAVLLATAFTLIGLATIGLLAGRDLGSARLLWLGLAAGGLVLVPATAVFAWLTDDVETRERSWPGIVMALLAIVAVAPPAVNVAEVWQDRTCWAQLECRWMVVQADQLSGDPSGPTTELLYGLQRATGTRLGTLVIATGGPGVSGVDTFDGQAAGLDPRLTAAYDIVVFDARGVGDSGYRDCPVASSRYSASLSFDASGEVVDTFVAACLSESGADRSRLDLFGSAQIAEDIDTIRADLGLERITLYGESYGTAVAQRYAGAHPDRIDALILDGPLDVTQITDGAWSDATRAFEDVLDRTLEACRADRICARDMADPGGAWRRLLGPGAPPPGAAEYADAEGDVGPWPLTAANVLDTLTDALYEPTRRMLALRALAAADRDDWVPMARLAYAGGERFLRPEAASDFAYYATWCADRVVGEPELDAAGYLRAARSASLRNARVGSVYLSGAACHAWPLPAGDAPRVGLPAGTDFPVLVLSATGDPITPPAAARRIAERYRASTDTYLLETVDGPHVTFGRGLACPDSVVVELLLSGTRPADPEIRCPGRLIAPYIGLGAVGRAADPLVGRARALDIELLAHPDYIGWDRLVPLTVGCRFGGRLTVTATAEVERIRVDGCAVVEGSPMRGTGSYDADTVRLDVTFREGRLSYTSDAADRYTSAFSGVSHWTGTFDGRPIQGRD